jgi:hypothetical protein
MGKKVVVNKMLKREKDHVKSTQYTHRTRARWLEHEICPRTGWIMGFRNVQDGFILAGHDSAEFKVTDTHRCALVVFWPMQRPVHVPMDGYRLAEEGDPAPYTTESGWRAESETYKRQLADLMRDERKNWPRDERGKWVKK